MAGMRTALFVLMLLSLAACEHFDWRASGRNFIEALCMGAEPCDVTCSHTAPGSGC